MIKKSSTNAPPDRGRLLISGGEAAWASALADALSAEGHRVIPGEGSVDLCDAVRVKNPDVIILYAGSKAAEGRALISELRALQPDLQIVLVSPSDSLGNAFAWATAGVIDFVEPFAAPSESILLTTRRAVERRWLLGRLRQLDIESGEGDGTGGLVGTSNAMREILRRVAELARTNAYVLIEGQEGTGRGTMARAMHLAGPRRDEPFIRVHCIEIQPSGAAGAAAGNGERSGAGATSIEDVFARAGRGTIFFEAIDRLRGDAQREMLARLEAQEEALMQGAGARTEQPRIIASTSNDLDLQVQQGKFEGDLYRRLKADSLRLPPLRDRREEIPAFVRHFLRGFGTDGTDAKGMDRAALNLLCRYEWPGNLRELEDCLRYAVALTGGATIGTDDLPEKIVESSRQEALGAGGGSLSLKGCEKHTIEQALSLCDGDVIAAATMLGVGRSTLYRKMNSHGVHRRAFRRGRRTGA
ncbi:MAG: sigma 54-interacting transcriptional regulator [Deltaproteobacteria bacterium]|nr:sigma 54-interacting transcriptional regulator [Deltaproteobacteria bacterium]